MTYLPLVPLFLVLGEGHLHKLLELVGMPQSLVNQAHPLQDVSLALGNVAQLLVVL